jgi:acetolactate synthase-1/2/3 large subunit
MDSIPMVVFTGQVPTPLIGNDAFQEVDIVGITRPCTKHNYLVSDVTKLAQTVREAYYIASTGRPGPVLVDLPKDVMQARTEFEYPQEIHLRSYNPNYSPHKKQIMKAARILSMAEKPIIYAGGGVISSNGSEILTDMARTFKIPVTATLMGLGVFPGDDPLWLGMLGMHGTYAANMAINNADVVIAVGARFDDRVTGKVKSFAPRAKIIHIDIDPTSIRKNVSVHLPVVSDCRLGLESLYQEMNSYKDLDWTQKHSQWVEQTRDWDEKQPVRYSDAGEMIKPQQVIEKIYKICNGDAIVSTEVGQNQMWAAQFYRFRSPRTLLTSGGLGTMGYGFPAAIGAQIAFPDKMVVDVAGDGSIQMNIQELATAVTYNLPVKVVILNNGYLGMVRQWQELFYSKNYCSTCLQKNPDFVQLAKAYGAEGYRVSDRGELETTLKSAFESDRPCIVDVLVEPEENVYPMVPAGASLTEMLLV